ncbi:MAG: ABC transporter ATP-binding protein [Armatimonadota bacterium]
MLHVDGVHATYGRTEVLRDVSLTVRQGEIASILGANGAGKTTLFRVISGLLKPYRGRVLLNGEDITRFPAYRVARMGLGQVPEGRQVFAGLSVLDNLLLAGHHGSAADRRQTVAEGLARVFELFPIMRERQRQNAGTLSGGQQQMLAIGRALMGRPHLLLLDEPSLGLAPLLVQETFRVIRQLNREGMTVVLIEQNAYAALRISDRAYVIEQGRVALSGTAASVLADENVRYLYLGRRSRPHTAGREVRPGGDGIAAERSAPDG